MAKIKPNEGPKLRVPGQKKSKLNLQIPAIRMPHEGLIDGLSLVPVERPDPGQGTPPQAGQVIAEQPTPRTPEQGRAPHPTQGEAGQGTPPQNAPPVLSAAPMSDFHKMDNSVTREIPTYFRSGKTKLIYDVLYLRSRGAIVSSRTVQMPKPELMTLAGIGSKHTMDKSLNHLQAVGLVKITVTIGEKDGNIFEIFTPKELGIADSADTIPTQGRAPQAGQGTPGTPSQRSPAQKLDRVPGAETALGAPTYKPINTVESAPPKTFFKDFLNPDDEKTIIDAVKRYHEAAIEITGTGLNRSNCEAIAELIDIYIAETGKAAGNTSSVSVYGKFGNANLRRMLNNAKNRTGGKVKYFDPGKALPTEDEVIDYVPEMLSDEQRQETVAMLRQIRSGDKPGHVEWYQSTCHPEDWTWLMENL